MSHLYTIPGAGGKPGEKPEKVLTICFTFTLNKLVPGRRHPGPGVRKPGWSPSYITHGLSDLGQVTSPSPQKLPHL